MLKTVCALALLATAAYGIPIENGVEGDPEIECGPTSIAINFNTQNNFEGHVYVKGRFGEDDCHARDRGRRVTGIELDFSTCGTARTRSANPLGVFVSTTVVVSFHPNFLTKVDRAYTIQCFYMEADKTVSTDIEVSMITTGFQTELVPMPVCRYEILDGPSGQTVQFAIIGQPVYHKWTCDTDTVDTFCMRVHSCFVDDGQGDRLDLIDADGCATDRYLVNNLEYPTDLMAQKEVHVFKYADRPVLQFQCQISITVKEPQGDCQVEAQPECVEPAGGGDGDGQPRKRRAALNEAAITDVASEFEVLDISASEQKQRLLPDYHLATHTVVESDGICLSSTGFGLLTTIVLVATVAVIVTIAHACIGRQHK